MTMSPEGSFSSEFSLTGGAAMLKVPVFRVTSSVAMNAGSVASFKVAVGNFACVDLDVPVYNF